MKTQIDFNKIVDVAEDGEIKVLEYVFTYGDEMRGATGHSFYPVSKSYFKERTKKSEVISFLMDCGIETKTEANAIYSEAKGNDNLDSLVFDTSYSNLWDYLRTELNLSENDAFIFECVGGGRLFDANFDGNFNTELSEIIREYETN